MGGVKGKGGAWCVRGAVFCGEMVGFESKMRWGDSLDEEDEQEEALPPPSVAGPDEHGIKTITEYHRNEKGQAVVVTTKVKVAKMQKKVYAISKERRNWAKFGDAFGQDSSENITMRSREDIMLERINLNTSTNEADKKIKTLENALSSNDNTMVVGSLRDLLYKKRMERQLMAARGLIDAPEKPPGEDDVMGGTSKGGYVAPGMRGGPGSAMGGESMRRPRDENSIRVTNLSEDTREH